MLPTCFDYSLEEGTHSVDIASLAPPSPSLQHNAAFLEQEMKWAAAMFERRIRLHFESGDELAAAGELRAPDLYAHEGSYASLLRDLGLGAAERLILIMALAPCLRPQLLDIFFTRNEHFDRVFTEFGGRFGAHGGFHPTIETAAFVLCGEDLAQRLALRALFTPEQVLLRERLLDLGPLSDPQALFSAPLRMGGALMRTIIPGPLPDRP